MKFAKLLIAVAAAAAAFAAHAESDLNVSNTAGASASAKLDFRITVPRIIFLRVGTGTNFADALGGANINMVDFTLTANDLTSVAPIAGVPNAGASSTAGSVDARVLGNGGDVSFRAVGSGAGLTAPGVTTPVAWSQIAPTSTGSLPHPTIGGGAANLTATNNVVNASSTWKFDYLNANAISAGVYTGQVTYTAALP